MKTITRAVWVLSLVSLFTDISSEMLYPIMPVYLKQIGFTIVWIGILEGVAEAVAGFSKSYFGQWSDVSGRRLPFVRFGYFLSALSKPLMGIFTAPLAIFSARSLDRLGKGIRTAARDALLSDEATPATKGRVFGFHRAMDTLGATIGPLLALLFLYYFPGQYQQLFLWAIVPGLLATACTFLLREKRKERRPGRPSAFSFMRYWKRSNQEYRSFVWPMLLFTLFNSSDVFLLLKMKESGLNDEWVIGAYVFYNLVYAVFSYPLGIVADNIGLGKMLGMGLVLFAVTYFGFGLAHSIVWYFVLLLIYGIYAAATEGISKAIISNVVPGNETATAIGFYTGWQSIMTLLASSITGFIWFQFGAVAAFICSGAVGLVVGMLILKRRHVGLN
jgi:MFS family permease